MDSDRKLVVLRVFVKSMLRKKGLMFEKNLTNRDVGREVKELNEENQLAEPITVAEVSEIYLEIMEELVTEHFAMMRAKTSSK